MKMAPSGSAFGSLRTLLFGISPNETSFARRGFRASTPELRTHLERVGLAFVEGYHAALHAGQPDGIAVALGGVEPAVRGFAFEGAAMAFAILDVVVPWRRDRLPRFLSGEGANHAYMLHVGAGWALARLRRPLAPMLARVDPVLGWLVIDGYGFHEGYFRHDSSIGRRSVSSRLKGYERRAFDQGLGRSLWFVCGADAEHIASTISAFPVERRSDLWSGVGLACAYAGGVLRATIEQLFVLAGEHVAYLAQGAAFAAKARERAGNIVEHTEIACAVLCGCSAAQAAAVTDEALVGLPNDNAEPAYEVWRQRVRAALNREIAPS